MITLKQTCP